MKLVHRHFSFFLALSFFFTPFTCRAEERTITFRTIPPKCTIYVLDSGLRYRAGISDEPIRYTLTGSGSAMVAVFQCTRDDKLETVTISSTGPGSAVSLEARKFGYKDTEFPLSFERMKGSDNYPDLRSRESLIKLPSLPCKILIRTVPAKAHVSLLYFSDPAPADMGFSDRVIDLDMTGFAEGQNQRAILTAKYYKRLFIDIDSRVLQPNVITTIPPSDKPPFRLKPVFPVISPVLYAFSYRPGTSLAMLIISIAALWSLIRFVIVPPIKRHRENMQRLEAWNALSRRVDREDPMFNKLIGGYRILEKLGAGGMATVYKAIPEATLDEKESVAIKIMQGDKADNEDFTERFKREMRISSEMNHPNILRILDFGDDEGVLYIVMEIVRGKPLRKVIPDEGYDLVSFMEIYRPILQALKYAHEKNVIHRDLKPDNIMMTDLGRIVVMDFGLARHQGGSMISASGVAIGTPAYMSPEQVSGKSLDARTDQYSLGILAFQMLTGQLPFYDENTINIMFKHVSDPPPPLRQYRSDIPLEVEQVVLRMLEKAPKDRYKDLEDVLRSMGAATRTRK